MFNRIFLVILFFFLHTSNILLSQDISFKVTEISGLAFIEKPDINKSLRAFRGSEVHNEYRLRTSDNTQAEITLNRRGDKIGNITVPQNTIILVNPIISKDEHRVSISLLEGYIRVNIIKNIDSLVEVHTATTTSVVKGTSFEVAFAEDGSTIVLLDNGSIDIYTDESEKVLNPKEAYINTMNNQSKIVKQNEDSIPIVFLNKCEEASRENYIYTIENLMNAMENIQYNNNNNLLPLVNNNDNNEIKNLEMKYLRMIAANEGYYNTIIKLINLEPNKKNEMIPYARKSLILYSANQRAISKMASSVIKTKEKFDRIKKKFNDRMMSSSSK